MGLLCLIVLLSWKSYNDILVIKQYQKQREDKNRKTKNTGSPNSGLPTFCSELSGHCEVYPWWRYAHWVHPGWGYKYYHPMLGWYYW